MIDKAMELLVVVSSLVVINPSPQHRLAKLNAVLACRRGSYVAIRTIFINHKRHYVTGENMSKFTGVDRIST